MELDPRRTAIIAVHFQNDVITPDGAFGALFAEQATATGVVPTTKALQDAARAAGALVVYTRVAFQPGYGDLVGNFPLLAMVGQQGCLVDGTPAADIVDELLPAAGDIVVTHQRVSGFVGSELDAVLRGRGIDTVVITGVATNISVESTARSAGDLGYRTIVVSDACSAAAPEVHQASLETLGLLGEVVTGADVLAALKDAGVPA
ncbi:cysteine hydrolase family protein [Pseudonocardia bannensis]|uniref:Cysteine hydrolase family protein n=1 Tax=Pseudonocardia bannensis TaxID=630973 RepID=A0A848DBM9_9PSEU|nr:cysteine hydrolase family protein [Pseudonocardia bannensis]NMH90197.1 cysteine hydrolase family protein [Pseudonocardia bannensis]